MDIPESPELIFTLLYTRFMHGKKVIFYDNACNGQDFGWLREPWYFRETIFLSDRFHQKDHTKCSSGFDANMYWWAKFINTQVCEIGNSVTNKIKTQAAFMTIDHFYLYLRFFLMCGNRRRKDTIVQSLSKRLKKDVMTELHTSLDFVETFYFGKEKRRTVCSCLFCV
jgi:hypothetical protein